MAWDRREQLEIQQQEQEAELFEKGLTQDENGKFGYRPGSKQAAQATQDADQVAILQRVQNNMKDQLARQAMAILMRRFTDSGGDANVITKAMQTDQILKEAFNSRGAMAFANINMSDPGDIEMMKREGITQAQLNDPEFVKEFGKNTWKALSPEGEWRTGLLRNLLSEVGSGTYDLDPDLFEDIEHRFARLTQLFKGTDLDKQDRDADLADRTLAQQVNKEGRAADNEDEKTRLAGVNNAQIQQIDFLRTIIEGDTAEWYSFNSRRKS